MEEEHHYSATPPRGFDPEEVKRRIQEQAKRKEEKLEALRKAKEAKELEGCTFAPTTKKATVARDLSKFLEDQKRFVEMKEQKQQERRERQLANEQSQVVPVGVNAKSRKILEEKKGRGEPPLSPSKAAETTKKQPFLQKNASRASVNKVVERRPSTVSAMA